MTNNKMTAYHTPILLQEVIEGLAIRPEGCYVDCTFGGGGHSRELLKHLDEKGKLIVFDQDADAALNLPADDRVIFVQHNFRYLQRFLRLNQVTSVDGIMADLGVSSHQFDEADRGFSTRFEGELDMRMDNRQVLTAWEVINTYSEERLHKLFELYGEVTNARTLARTIVEVRKAVSMKTIGNFKAALNGIVKGNPHKYFAQVFQALRIEVNDELGALQEMLQQVPSVLKPGGRIAIITFHSLEDRIVKNFFKGRMTEEPENLFEQWVKPEKTFEIITKKPLTADDEEVRNNPRSRSAKLRIAERLNEDLSPSK